MKSLTEAPEKLKQKLRIPSLPLVCCGQLAQDQLREHEAEQGHAAQEEEAHVQREPRSKN
jgi:hypothetical protein